MTDFRFIDEREGRAPRSPSANAPVVQVRARGGYYEPVNELARNFGELACPLFGHHLETIRDRFRFNVEILP